MATISPEEVLANAINPMARAVGDYGNNLIALANQQRGERLAVEHDQRQLDAARALAVLRGQIEGANAAAVQAQHAKNQRDLTIEAIRQHTAAQKEMLPLQLEQAKEIARAQEDERIRGMSEQDLNSALLKYQAGGFIRQKGESKEDAVIRAGKEAEEERQKQINAGAKVLQHYDDMRAGIDQQIAGLKDAHIKNVTSLAQVQATKAFFNDQDMTTTKGRGIFGDSIADAVKKIMAKKNVPLDVAIGELAKSDPVAANAASQVFRQALAEQTAAISEAKAPDLQREIGGLQNEKTKLDFDAARFVEKDKNGSEALSRHLESNPTGGNLPVARAAAFQNFLTGNATGTTPAGAGTVLKPSTLSVSPVASPGGMPSGAAFSTTPVALSGNAGAAPVAVPSPEPAPSIVRHAGHAPSAAIINPSNAARMLREVGPGLGSPADVYDAATSGEEMSPTEVLAARILAERPKGFSFMTPATPTEKAWHDTLAAALGVEPQQIGSSVFSHSPGSVLRARYGASDADTMKAINKLPPGDLERLAASVLAASPQPMPKPGVRIATPQVQMRPVPQLDAGVNPWILNPSSVPAYVPPPQPFQLYPRNPMPEEVLSAP